MLSLMGLGLVLGPVLYLANAASLTVFAPYFGTVALAIHRHTAPDTESQPHQLPSHSLKIEPPGVG